MKCYQGKFNWYGESIILETMAADGTTAKNNMFYQLSMETNMDIGFIHRYYHTRPGGWKITEQKVAQDLVN